MTLDKILVAFTSIAGIGFIYWFFLGKKDETVVTVENNSVDIVVEGGYKPNIISIPKGKTTTLNFMRRDPSSCLEEVVISDFKIRKYLPLNKVMPIEINPKESGEYNFECGMNMFHGKIIVK